MKTSLLLLLAIVATLTSCNESEIVLHEDAFLLHERFHGKYKIVTSTSNKAVDINKDGQASTDLLQEISFLSDAELELRIPVPGYNTDGSLFLFTQFWQQQFLTTVNSDTVANYAVQGVVRYFRLSQNVDEILVAPDQYQVDLKLFPLPDEVTIESNGYIKVVMQKLLYTSEGWKSVNITTLYKRYTMAT